MLNSIDSYNQQQLVVSLELLVIRLHDFVTDVQVQIPDYDAFQRSLQKHWEGDDEQNFRNHASGVQSKFKHLGDLAIETTKLADEIRNDELRILNRSRNRG